MASEGMMKMDARSVAAGMKKLEEGKPLGREAATPGQPRQPRQPRVSHVKNKAAAPVQITAEQLLREAHDVKEAGSIAPKQQLMDADEIAHFRGRKRKEFEDTVRMKRNSIGTWMKYASWEAGQKEFDRARSVWERALDVDPRNQSLWLKYAEMEMKNRFVNFARNIWDRAVVQLPRVDQFWYKYAYMEEMLGNVGGARQIFERWMTWMPDTNAWNSYIRLEIRHKNYDRARGVYERFIKCHLEVKSYLKYAKFESQYGTRDAARNIFQRALVELGEDAQDEELFIAFAEFEVYAKEYDRARVLYKYALDHIPKHKAKELYAKYTSFEKQFGDRSALEDVILSKRRFQYEEELKENSRNYDVWWDYTRLEEDRGEPTRIREVYERAIGAVPPIADKRLWQRYIFLWLKFANYEELVAKDVERTRAIYTKVLEIIPHRQFTFAKLWLAAAHFEVRQKNLEAARRILGTSIGIAPRERVFKGYIELELQLGNMDRCRKLYEKYLEFMPANCYAWSKYAELESSLSETERARAIFELAVGQPTLDLPEVLWKTYIDFEIKLGEYDNTRTLYKRLLTRTKHVKVWISRAQFEASIKQASRARDIFTEADDHFKSVTSTSDGNKEERVMLLESWLDFEKNFGDATTIKHVADKLPRRIKKRRELKGDDGSHQGWEEYYDYIFPDQEARGSNLKLLEMARKWKKARMATEGDNE